MNNSVVVNIEIQYTSVRGEGSALEITFATRGMTRDTKAYILKKIVNVSRPSEHSPGRGRKMSKRLGGIIGCKGKTSSWHLIGFPDGSDVIIGSTL